MDTQILLTERHVLSYVEASARLHKLGDYLAAKYGLKVIWVGDRVRVIGKIIGIKIDVTMILLAGHVELRGVDPGVLWRGIVEDFLREQFKKYLDPLISIDALPVM